jgi:hypothetical protein
LDIQEQKKQYREFIHQAYQTALSDVLEVRPEEKTHSCLFKGECHCKGHDERESFNEALSQWSKNITKLK